MGNYNRLKQNLKFAIGLIVIIVISSCDGYNRLNRDLIDDYGEETGNSGQQSQIAEVTASQAVENTTVKIIVLGRSDSGISSTIRELIGPESECTKPNENATFKKLMEYTISGIPSPDINENKFYTLKLLDVPGFAGVHKPEQDAQILASFKSYMQSEGPPDFYLALSRFDDDMFDNEHSLFVQFLKKVELFQNTFLNNTEPNLEDSTKSNIIFLLTHLMGDTKSAQRKPESKIADFRRVIRQFTVLQPPVSIVVGDNNVERENNVAKVENGYYKLPNKEYYPKNVWQALIDASTVDDSKANLLTWIMNNRGNEMKCKAKLISTEWDYCDDDADAFSYLLTLPNTTIEENEINTKIQDAFDKISTKPPEEIVQKVALQLRLQQVNITAIGDLPTKLSGQAEFFQQNKQFSAVIPAKLLKEAFQLRMPEYVHRLTVGYGYVVMSDEISEKSPFITGAVEPSSIGYLLPNFMKCKKLASAEIQYFKSYSVNMSDYVQQRLSYLEFAGKDNITEENFRGKVKEGLNLQPEEGENVVTLTAVEEHRVLKCNLVSDLRQVVLDPEFIAEVDALSEFDQHNRESVADWINWFDKWGSHVVVEGYGGGAIHGSIVGSNVKKVLESRPFIDETLNAIVEYKPFPVQDLGVPAYRLYGGESDSNTEHLYTFREEERRNMIRDWENTLKTNFKLLTTEFRLEPISLVVTEKMGVEKGEMIGDAITLLLNGELKYTRRRRGKTGRGGNNDKNPRHLTRDLEEGRTENTQVGITTTTTTELPETTTTKGQHETTTTKELPEISTTTELPETSSTTVRYPGSFVASYSPRFKDVEPMQLQTTTKPNIQPIWYSKPNNPRDRVSESKYDKKSKCNNGQTQRQQKVDVERDGMTEMMNTTMQAYLSGLSSIKTKMDALEQSNKQRWAALWSQIDVMKRSPKGCPLMNDYLELLRKKGIAEEEVYNYRIAEIGRQTQESEIQLQKTVAEFMRVQQESEKEDPGFFTRVYKCVF